MDEQNKVDEPAIDDQAMTDETLPVAEPATEQEQVESEAEVEATMPTPAPEPSVVEEDVSISDEGVLGAVKDAIPGDMDDKVIDAATNAVAGAAGAASDAVDAVTDKIPGEMDDKLVDGAKDAIGKAGGVVGDVADKISDLNPFKK